MSTARLFLVFGALALCGVLQLPAPAAWALVDLEWRPACHSVEPGETVYVGLYAVSDDETDQSMSGMDVILLWDETKIQLLGVTNNGPYSWLSSGFPNDVNLDGLNNTWADGNAFYSAFAQLGQPAYATPEGLLVTTFRFLALSGPSFSVIDVPEHVGQYSYSRVISGEVPGLVVTGFLGEATVGVGFFDPVYAYLNMTPISGTVPFTTHFLAVIGSNYTDQRRRLAGRIDVRLDNDQFFSNWRSGYTNLSPRECYSRSWNQPIPAIAAVVGANTFRLLVTDVTPSPYNQPPYAPSGVTDTDTQTLTCYAP